MQNLVQMLKEYDIKNVISIDDGWEMTEGLEEKIEKSGIDANMTVTDFCDTYGIEIDVEEEDGYKEYGDTLIKELENIKDRMPQIFNAIYETLQVDIEAELKTLKRILNQLGGEFAIHIGNKFSHFYRELEGNTLYILDKNMGVNRENEFLDYMVNIIDERKDYNDLVIVYSNDVSGLLEHDQKVEYIESNNSKGNDLEVLYQFWPLAKITDETQLVDGIREMVSKSMYGRALSKMAAIKKISVEKALKDLLHINVDTLDDMIIEAYVEGGKITESYELLIDSLIKKNLLEQIMATDVLNYEKELLRYSTKRSAEIMKSITCKNQYNSMRIKADKKKLLDPDTLLFNIADYSINKGYNNPSMGDIYVFTEARSKKKYDGMLISQECSIMIRMQKYPDNINRKADELLLLLFDIEEVTKENIDKVSKKLDDCIWPIKIDEKICLLRNAKRSMYICPEILDLCGLNASGESKIQFEEEGLEYKSDYSREFYKDYRQIVENKIEDAIVKVRPKEVEIKATEEDIIKNMIVSLAFGVEFKENFQMRRICKIDEKQTLHIIHEYLNGIAKIGVNINPNQKTHKKVVKG